MLALSEVCALITYYRCLSVTEFLCMLCFYRAASMQSGRSHERNVSVRPSVCLSVKRVNCDKTKETCVHIFIPHKMPFVLVYRQEEWLVEATPCT